MNFGGEHSYWVHNLSPFLVRFSDGIGIRYYSLAYIAAFVVAWLLLRSYWRAGRSKLGPEMQSSLIVAVIVGVIAGGRIGYFLLYSPGRLLSEPLALFKTWEGGMASHGGFVGVLVALVFLVRRYHLEWRPTADLLVTLAPPGFFFGRIANFINGELWGKISNVPWAVIFPQSAPMGTPVSDIPPRHPSQIYEAFLEGIVLAIYTQWRFWRGNPGKMAGHLTGEFLILYGVVRVIGELFREPDASLVIGLSRGTFYSIFLILAGVVLLGVIRHKSERAS